MNCLRYIKLKILLACRKNRLTYTDDKGRIHELKHLSRFKHEQKRRRIKGENFRNYGV